MKNFNFANKMLFSFRKSISALTLFLLFSTLGIAQPWTYNFGTGTGSFTSSTPSTTFLPAPTSGTARVRVGTNPGSFTLANPGIASLGSGSELQFASNTGSTSTTKFSIHDYTGGQTGYAKFNVAFSGGTDGVYTFWMGDGLTFSDNSAMTNAQIFAGLRWTLGASNTVSYSVSNAAGTFITTGLTNPTTLFTQSTSGNYAVEVYCNNSAASTNYLKSGVSYSLASYTWDLWVNGSRVGTGLAKAGLGNAVNFDSFALNHQSSAVTPGIVYLDDFEYSNSLPQPVSVNGVIGTNEYGTHTNGSNQQSSATATWFSSWDATKLYFGVTGGNIAEASVVYLDFNPIVPVNGGTNANGNLTGFNNYDGSSFSNLQFRADIAMYFKNGFCEYRLADGAGGWGAAVTSGLTVSASGTTREFSIPWTAMGSMPVSFNWFGHIAYAGGGAYGSVPTENPGSGAGLIIGASARWDRYYTVSSTTIGSSTLPFSRNSYTFTSASDISSFGAISAYDFTMNSTGRFLSRTGAVSGNWSIAGTLVASAGSIYLGSGAGPYGTTAAANLDVRGGLLDIDFATNPLTVSGNVALSGGTLKLSSAIGGDLTVAGNWNFSGGTFTPSSRRVTFNGTTAQTLTGATTFDYLTFNNTSGANPAVTLASSITANQDLVLTNGIIQLGANNITVTNTTSAAVSSAAATAFVQTNSTGQLRRSIATAGLPITYLFPVGTGTTYAPASFNFSANNTARNLHLRAVAGTHPSNGTPTNFIANRYWNSDLSSSTGTYSYTSQFTFQAGDVNGTIGSIKLGKYNGSAWSDDAGSSASGTVLSSGTLTETSGSLAATSDWAGRTSPATTTLSASSLTAFGSVCINTTTVENSFTITGTALTTANVTVAALAGFTYSTTAGGTYTSSLTLTQPGGAYSQIIYVRFSPTAAISYNGNIAIGGGGATSINVAAAGSGINTAPAVTTTVATAVTSSTASSGGSGITSACGTITSRGVVWGLSANPTIPSANSTSDGTGTVTYTSSITGLTSGTLYNYRAYVTNSNGLASYGTNLTFTTLKNEPSNYPTSFACGTTTSTTIPLTWTDASAGETPDGYLIQWSNTGYGSITPPTDGTAVSDLASAVLGAKNIAQGVGSYTIPSLSSLTTYYIRIWSYTNSGSNINFKLVSEPQTSCATLIAPVTIWTNPITGTNPGLSNPWTTGDSFDPLITVSGIGMGSGILGTAANDRYNANTWNTGAFDVNDYFSFTLTPNTGYLINLNNLVYTGQASGTGPTNIAIRSSIDAYTANIGTPTIGGTTISLTAGSYQNITSAITFRVYAWGGTGGTYSINDFTYSGNVLSIGTLITSTSVGTSFCAGASGVSVPFTYTPSANFPSGTCTFTTQLSNASGSFASPVTLQSVTSDGSGSQSISATIPALTSTGSGYRIRVVSASPGVNGSDNASNISISNTATSIAPSTTQNITSSTNGSTLTVTEGTTASSRVWKYGTISGVYGTSTGITTSTYTPNFVLPGTYYIVCVTTYPAPCSNVVTSNEVQVNVVGSVDYTWNGSASSDWSNSSNWTPNGVPIIDDNVTINVPGTNTLIVTDARSINNLTVSGTGTFQLTSSGALSVYASVTNSIAGSPTFDCASNFSILSASSQTIPSWNFGNLIASGGARVLSSSGTIGICGTFTPGAGAYTNTGSTVNFNGTGAQTVNVINYNNLSISGAHTTNSITLPAGLIGVAGTFSPTATFSSGSYSNTGNTIDYNGTGAQTVAAFPSYNNLTISGARASATVTLASGTIGVAGTFNPSATLVSYVSTGNTFDYTSSGSQTIAIFSQYNNLSNSGNGARTLANGIIAVYGTYTPTSAAITVGTSTIDFTGTAGQTIPASFYYNITNSSNTNRTWASSGIIDIKNAFTPTTSTNTITGSTVQYSATSGTLNLTTFTTNVASRNYNNLIFNGTGGNWTLNGNTIGVANDLTVSAGTLLIGSSTGAATLNIDGNLTIASGAVFNATNSTTLSGSINLAGNLSNAGILQKSASSGTSVFTFNKTSGTQTFSNTGTISNNLGFNIGTGSTANKVQLVSNIAGSSSTYVIANGSTIDFQTFILTGSGAFTSNTGSSIITANVIGTGAITNSGANGSIQSTGLRTYNAATNYFFNGASAQNTGNGFTTANNVTINNASGVSLTSAATINGILSFTSGLLDIAAVNLTIGSTGSIAGANTTKYVKTSGAGQLKMTVAASNVLFPVGRSAYNPLTLNNSGTSDVFGVVLADAISQALNNSSLVVNRSWNITENIAGGSNLSIVSLWNGASEQAAGFAGGTTPRIAYWNGSAWVQTGATQAGSNPFTFTSTANISGISPASYSIAIGKDDAFNCTSVPTVSLILPTSGYSGDVITINGTGLTGLTSATIGGTAATVLSQSGTSATLSVGAGATGVITVSKSALCSASGSQTFTYNGFISAQTGNWSLGSTWQGGVVPPDLATVTIANSHLVTVDDLTNPASVIINAGAELTGTDDAQQLYVGSTGNGPVSVTGTLSLGTALVSNGWLVCGTLSVNNGGIFNNNCGNAIAAGANVTSLTLASGATYNHNALGSTLNGTLSDFPGLTGGTNISINSNANVNFTKWAQNGGVPVSLPSVSGGQWGNVTVNITGQTYTGSWQNSGILTNATSLNIVNTGSRDFRLVTPTGTAGFTCNIGSVNVSGGIFVLIGGGSAGSGVVTMNVTNDFNVSGGVASIHGTPNSSLSYNTTGVTLNVGGNLNITGGSFYGHANPQSNIAAVSSSVTTLNVTGNLSIDNGTLNLAYLPNYNFAGNTGNVNLNVKGNFTLGSTGILRNSNSIAPLGKTTATVNFNHASAQQTWTQTGTIQDVIGFNVNGTANTLQLLSNANIGTSTTSSFNVANATTFDMQAFVLGGSGTFTAASGSTLKMGNANGIKTIPTLSGNVQLLAARTFNAAANYSYTGSVNQVTGNGLPSTITGALSIANTGAASNNTVTLSTTGTTVTTLNLTSGLFAAGAAQQLNIASAGTVNATSGDFETGANAGILNFPGAGTFTGNSNPYNVYTSGGVNFGSGTVTIQPTGTFRINSGGFVNTNAPFYASGSALQYNTTGVYGRNIEWRASSGRGYPHHVQVSNSTTLNPGANSNTGQPFNAGGNLTIDAGSNIYMDFGGLNMSVPLTVTGGLNLNGNLSLSGSIGGDINVGGDWTNNGTASNFFPNNRAVTFNGSVNQNIGGTNTSANPFAFVTINNAAGVTLTFGQSVSNTLTFSAGNLSLGIYDLTISPGASISGASSSKFIITNGTGRLIQNLVNNSSAKTYPIGANSSAYTPAILSQTASGVTDNIGVRVSSAPAFDNAVNDNTQMIGAQWTINESVAGGNNLVTSFQWPQAIEGASFVRANGVFHGNWTGSSYVVRPTSASSGSDPYTSTSTVNYTSTLSNQPFVLGNINGVLGCFSSTASGSWNSNSTWSSGIVPVSGVSVCLNHNITIGSADPNPDAVLGVTLNGSSTLDIHSSKTLTFSNGGALINNSGLVQNIGAGTVLASGVLAISGANSITMGNLTLNGNTTITTSPTISGNLTLNSGAFLTAAPTYGNSSTLIYNTGGSYNVGSEWTNNLTTAGLGAPKNVTLNGSFLTMPNTNRGLSGDLNITSGSLDLNLISGDLYIAGNWNRNIGASFNANNRAVFFNGASNQTIMVTGGDAETFAYLVQDKSAGNLIIDNTQPSDVAINGSSGNILQINSGNTFDLNGRNLSLVGTGGNVNLPSGSSTITGPVGSNFIIWNGAKTVTPSLGATLNFDSNVTVVLNNGFNFGATTSTINGTLQIANGGFVSTNPPTYASGSTLRYFTGSNFNRGLEWSTNSGPGYPHHVVLDLNSTVTTVNLAPGAATCQVAGNLTVNNGAILNMGAMVNPLVVLGDVTIGGAASGTLSLSSVAGGDIKIGGNLTRNTGGLLTQNSREVEMNGSVLQTITGVTTFDFLAVNNSASSVRLTDNSTINNRLRLSNGQFDLNGLTCTLTNGSKILRVNGTMSASPTVTGINVYDLEYQNSVTSSFEYLASSTAVRDLIITTGNTLTLGDNRTFNRDLTLSGGDLNLGGYTLTARGRATAPSFSGSITVSGGGSRSITGPAGSTFDITGLGANLPNDYTKTVSSFGGSTLSFDSNVLVRIGDGAVDFGVGSPTTINGTLQVLLAGSVGQILNPCYYGVNSLLRFSNTVDYQVGLNDKTWTSGAISSGNPGIPYNVEVLDVNTDLQLQSTRALRGNLTITNGTFTLTPAYTGSFNIGGNWTRSGATSAFNHNTKKVVFDRQSAGNQTLTVSSGVAAETFYDLEISLLNGNLTSASASPITINNNLNFVSGKMDIGANQLTIGTASTNGTISGAGSSNYVISNAIAGGGNIKAFTNSNATYNFPVGDVTNYSPMSVTLTNGAQAGSFITTATVQGAHPNMLTATPPSKYISRYWSVEPTGLAINPVYNVSYSYVVADEVGSGTLYPVKYSTSTTTPGWQSCPGSTAAAITGTSGSNDNVLKTFTWNGLTTFSDFSGAGDGSPLPVTWLNFDAQFNNATSNVDVSWATASEINNDYFEVMRSVDAVNFEVVGTVDGAGNSSLVKDYTFVDANPLTGLSYYKIRQVDFNGQSDNTEIRAVSNLGGVATGTLFAYPNPLIGQELTIVYSNLDKGNWEYRLVDITGKIVLAQNRNSELNAGAFTLNLEQLPAGVYLLQLKTQSQNFTRKITISK